MAWRQPTRPAGGAGGGGDAGLLIISGMCSTLATGGGAEMIVHASATKLGPGRYFSPHHMMQDAFHFRNEDLESIG